MIFGIIEPYIEVFNLALALLSAIAGFFAYRKLRGEMKKGAGYLLAAIFLFAFHEVVGILAEFGIFEIEGFYAFTEFAFIIVLLISMFVFLKLFGGISKKNE